jgi:hypothetical protein
MEAIFQRGKRNMDHSLSGFGRPVGQP